MGKWGKSKISGGSSGCTRRSGNYQSFGGGYRSFKDGFISVSLLSSRKKFGDKSSGRTRVKAKDQDDTRSYNCQWFRHYARDRTKPKLGGQK